MFNPAVCMKYSPNTPGTEITQKITPTLSFPMSYDVHLFRTETKLKHQQSNAENFFEDETNFTPFTADQKEELKSRLIDYEFAITGEDGHGIHLEHTGELSITALLTDNAVWFTSGFDEDSVFEVGM